MLISAVELAGLQLPKLPNSRQGIEYHAKKNNWPFEEVAGRARGGKLKKYLVSALPSEVQAAIREKQAATLLAKVPVLPAEVKKPLRQNKKMRQLGLIPCEEGLARLDDRQTETAHARCAIVAHVLPLHELAGMPIKKAVAFVVAEAAAGRLPEDVARLISNRFCAGWVRLWPRATVMRMCRSGCCGLIRIWTAPNFRRPWRG